jgi:hypothetical protein
MVLIAVLFTACTITEIEWTLPRFAVVETSVPINILDVSAKSGGKIIDDGGSPVRERGVCFSTKTNPTIVDSLVISGNGSSGIGFGSFESNLSGLKGSTTYYIRAYATTKAGTAYGNEFNFTTLNFASLITQAVSSITLTSAVCGGIISVDGGASVSERGICFSTSKNSTPADTLIKAGSGVGEYSVDLLDLQPGTTYYVRAYAINLVGMVYGNEVAFTTASLPTLSTVPANLITMTTAKSGGVISNTGSSPVVLRGICFDTNKNPTILNSLVTSGMGSGSFTSSIVGLNPGTTYYMRAFATNSSGTSYGDEISFSTSPILVPILSTTIMTSITRVSAITGGNVTNDGGAAVTNKGICYNTAPNPTIENYTIEKGEGKGVFSSSMTGLIPGMTYYVRAYATNSAGTAYGNEIIFTTIPISVPNISTNSTTSITRTTAVSGGNVTNDGGDAVTSKGICYGTTYEPSLENNIVEKGAGKGSFIANIVGLIAGTTYHVRAYATNSAGTAYGNDITFTTSPILVPTLSTATVSSSSITRISAVSGGNITNDGGDVVTARGICYSTAHEPTVLKNVVENGAGTGNFTAFITGLTPGTTYYVRAYAINSAGTAYGNEITFTTNPIVAPTINTTLVLSSSVSRISATSGGNVTNDGGDAVFSRGICYSTTHDPTIAKNVVENGAGNGVFIAEMTGLTPGTTYYVRAYATNNVGTAYGNEITFTTLPPFKIGQSYQGGIIFYLDATNLHGLICPTFDQSASAAWGCSGSLMLSSNGMAIGTGLANTIGIINECTTIGTAARLCYDLVVSGYNDWYLPSHDELRLMYNNLKLQGLGSLSNLGYWSSSQSSATSSYSLSFLNGIISQSAKTSSLKVRAIRAF